MGTTASIAIQNPATGVITQTTTNFDGYISVAGTILSGYYNRHAKINALISLGELRYLEKSPNPYSVTHSNVNPDPGVAVAYHRDAGEDFVEPQSYADFDEYLDKGINDYAYDYIFIEDQWFVNSFSSGFKLLKDEINANNG